MAVGAQAKNRRAIERIPDPHTGKPRWHVEIPSDGTFETWVMTADLYHPHRSALTPTTIGPMSMQSISPPETRWDTYGKLDPKSGSSQLTLRRAWSSDSSPYGIEVVMHRAAHQPGSMAPAIPAEVLALEADARQPVASGRELRRCRRHRSHDRQETVVGAHRRPVHLLQ